MKTPFLWAGNKNRSYRAIKPYITKFTTYYETFLGGGAVYFRLLAERGSFKAHCTDVNEDLINTYEMIRDDPEGLIALLPPTKDKATFQALTTAHLTAPVERAAQFLYLNRNRFFGMGGWMNADRYAREAVIERIRFFSPRMQQSVFSGSCWDCMFDAGGFVFCDPPYPETNNSACYKISDLETMKLNKDFLVAVSNSTDNLFWVTKHGDEMEDLAKSLGLKTEKKEWIFRKPTKGLQSSFELYISRNDDLFQFS